MTAEYEAFFAGIWEAVPGPAWEARCDLSSAQYQAKFDELFQQGFRLVDVSCYLIGDQVRYAAIWEQRGGPAWAARHDMTKSSFQAIFDDLVQQGYRLTRVSGCGGNDGGRYAALFEQSPGPAWEARIEMTRAEFQQRFNDFTSKGFRLIDINGYGVGQEARFAGIWEQRAGSPWQAYLDMTQEEFQARFDDLSKQGYRLKRMSGYWVGDRNWFAGIWEQGDGPAWIARLGMPVTLFQSTFNDLVAKNFRMTHMLGYPVVVSLGKMQSGLDLKPGYTEAGTETNCWGIVLWCKDWVHYPDGIEESSWYICGACVGLPDIF